MGKLEEAGFFFSRIKSGLLGLILICGRPKVGSKKTWNIYGKYSPKLRISRRVFYASEEASLLLKVHKSGKNVEYLGMLFFAIFAPTQNMTHDHKASTRKKKKAAADFCFPLNERGRKSHASR